MRVLAVVIAGLPIFASCNRTIRSINPVTYPETRKSNAVTSYSGIEIADPYRWLEDDSSAELSEWVRRQNETTQSYLSGIPYRDMLRERLKKIWNYEKIGRPFSEGGYMYFYKNDGLQNQNVLYRRKGDEKPEVFLDPNTFSGDGTTSLSALSFTRDGSLVAYLISEAGSDWRKAIVMDAKSLEVIEDTLSNIKFSNIAWKGNEGFFYSSYDKPEGSELSAKTDQHKVYYHKLRSPQKEDRLIYGGSPDQKHRYVFAGITEDERFVSLLPANSTSGNKLLLLDLQRPNPEIVTILGHEETDTRLIANRGDTLYLMTNLNAPRNRIVTVQAADPGVENWKDFIPETENVLNASTGGGYFFAEYMIDALSRVIQYNYDGDRIREIELPDMGSASGFSGKETESTLYFSFTNYKTPTSIYWFDARTGTTALYWSPEISFNADDYVSEQVFYTSKDGTSIPMIITYRKGLRKTGNNPAILYGYGGFNISLTPSFSVANAVWMEQGGIYAVPNIRGGGEYGKKWHDAGIRMKKQNVFDDFIAAAEFLIKEGYTSSDFLAIRGGSNGGLLVGAVLTQRPDLARVALPAAGVLDMLRYHTFTAGAGWSYDYGTAEESAEMAGYLLAYSPVHNVCNGVEYPATLISAADHDDRVVPAHSYKFAAALQEHQTGAHPVLIRIETRAGHGTGTPVNKTIEQYADIFAFTLFNMGFNQLPNSY